MSKIVFLLIAVIALAAFFLWPSDERRIRKLIGEGAAAIEGEDIDGVMKKVSFNYRDDYGFTHLYLKEAMKKSFARMKDIGVEYEELKIEVRNGTATAQLDVRVVATVGEETGYILGDLPHPVSLSLMLEKERGKWVIVRAEGLPLRY